MNVDYPPLNYPTSFEGIPDWASRNGVPVPEARQRFAQYAILRAIASSRTLRELLVFKGGNALDFVWSPNRSTKDLDFSVDMTKLETNDLVQTELETLLAGALDRTRRELRITAAVQSLKRKPPGEDKTCPTYMVNVGYALPDDGRNLTRIEAGQPSPLVVPVEISINEPIGEDRSLELDGTQALRVSTPEDIVAEKLRAFLQQKGEIRNRNRPQDLLDIAHFLRTDEALNLDKVSSFLMTKAAARNVPVSKTAFRDTELVERARYGYENLRDTVRQDFVPFDEALGIFYGFIDRLQIPKE